MSTDGDGGPPVKKQRRSRAGCLTCRADKKKCDEQQPRCGRCEKLSYECVWPKHGGEKPAERWRPAPRRVAISTHPSGLPPIPQPSDAPYAAGPLPPFPDERAWISALPVLPSPTYPSAMPDPLQIPTLPPQSSDTSAYQAGPSRSETVLSEGELLDLLRGLPNVSDPSTSNFSWQDTALYSLQSDSPVTASAQSSATTPATTTKAPGKQKETSEQVSVSRAQLQEMSSRLPRTVYALIEQMLAEQENGAEAILPLSYLINLGTWLDVHAFTRLLGHVTKVYSEHSRLREVIEELDLVSEGVFVPDPTKVKEVISPAEICALPNVSIDSKMSALMDLSYRHFCTGGIAKYYQTLHEIERFLYQSLRPNKAINIGMLNSPSHYGLACYIYADICRSVTLGYPTSFPYVFQPQSTHILTGTEYLNGCSDIVLTLIADTSNFRFQLERDQSARQADGSLSPLHRARADSIIQGLRGFKPYSLAAQENNEDDSLAHVSAVAVQELWRQGALIHFYQTIERLPAIAPQLQECLRQVFKLFAVAELLEPPRCPALLFVPAFLVATVATKTEDRQKIRTLMAGYDKVLGIGEDRQFVEQLWQASDKAGYQVDWHDLASETAGPAFL